MPEPVALGYESPPPTPATLRPARLALVLLLAINMFNYVDRQLLASVELDIRNQFKISEPTMGGIASAFLLVYMATSPIFGWFGDRGGRWKLVGISIILQSLASFGTGLAQGFASLLMMRCLVGIGEACYGPVAPTLISDLFPKNKRGAVLAWFYAAIPVGSCAWLRRGRDDAEADGPLAVWLLRGDDSRHCSGHLLLLLQRPTTRRR
ncbi:MAG: MFS transporter [Tepidisphaeraceae bacterium]